MAANEATAADVHAHAHGADLAAETEKPAGSRLKSARADATPARVIPHLRLVDQGSEPVSVPDDRDTDQGGFGSLLLDELAAGQRVAAAAAEDSDWARVPMTPVQAAKQVLPPKGEAGNWIIWSAMTTAGLARLLLVSLGHLVVLGGETRIRAGVVLGVLLTVLTLSTLLGYTAA